MADWWSKVRAGSERLKSQWADRQTEMRASAQKWMDLFEEARRHADHPQRLVVPLAHALEGVCGQLDGEARAVAVGLFRQSGVGRSQVDGSRITYVRPEGPARGQIRLGDVFGTSTALSAGVAATGFAACLYGERTALMEPLRWRGGDAGVLVASVGFFRADFEPVRPHVDTPVGWSIGVELGLGLGLPILSEIGGFDVRERVVGSGMISREAEPLEQVLSRAPDRRWLRSGALRLVRGKQGG